MGTALRTEARRARGRSRALSLVLVLGCFVLYGNTIGNGYSLDDEIMTRDHPLATRGVAAIPAIFSTPLLDFGGQIFGYRPLALSTFAVEHELFGADPHAGHFINVALYAMSVVVLFSFLTAVLRDQSAFVPFTATLIFLAHPIHTEVVASLKSRDEILVLLFGLAAARLFLAYRHGRRVGFAVAGAGALVLALLSKPSAVPFVGLIPLAVLFRYPADMRGSARLGAALVACLAGYLVAVLSFIPRLAPTPTFIENPLVTEPDLSLRIGTAMSSLLVYLQKMLIPYPLNFYYGYDIIEVVPVFSPTSLVSIVVHALMVVYVIRRFRSHDSLAFGLAWYLVGMAMYSNLIVLTKGIVTERSAYVASVGFAVALAALLGKLDRRARSPSGGVFEEQRRAAAALVVILILYSGIVIDRNRDWESPYTLYEADIARLERSAMANQIYSRQLRREFGPQAPSERRSLALARAIELSEQATRVAPDAPGAYAHIGAIYLHDLDDAQAALESLTRASDLAPGFTRAHHDALQSSIRLGRMGPAFTFAERLLAADPEHEMGLFYLAKLLFRRGDVREAFAVNDRLAEVAPDRDLAYLNYGYFYLEQSDRERAIENLEKALAIAPDNPPVCADLAVMLDDAGRPDRARHYREMGQGGTVSP